MSGREQRLVLSIIEFLNKAILDGTVKQDDREGLEVAVQCIGEAFGVDSSDSRQVEQLSIKPANLQSIFDVFIKTRDHLGAESLTSKTEEPNVSSADKAEAEKLKQSGNSLMTIKKYDDAIKAYTKAIKLVPTSAVYFSNRAAAYSSKEDHRNAISDAENAIALDPLFFKAYHRLGHAHYSLGEYDVAASAFQRGLDIDSSNESLKSGLQNAQARMATSTLQSGTTTTSPGTTSDPGEWADVFRGIGGASVGQGLPDLSTLMNNPMMMQMAQQMMANGGLDRLMQNPALANMMNRVQSGQGMPSMAEMMGDPNIREIANQFMGQNGSGHDSSP